MENKGRVMFDLNEIPEDDPDILSPSGDELPATEVGPRFTHRTKESEAQITNRNLPSNGEMFDQPSSSSSLVEAPPALGQHPLSCFRPFVRAMPKGTSTIEPIHSKEEPWSGGYNYDRKEITDDAKCDTVPSPAQNGNMAKSSEPSKIPPDLEMDDQEPDLHSNGHRILGSEQSGEGCDPEKASNKSSSKEASPQSSLNATVMSHAREAEDHKTALNASIIIDSAVKAADPPKGLQNSTETKFSTSFGKRGRMDQKDAMLGKKRNRQTMFLDVREAAKQAAPPKTPSVKKSAAASSRANKDTTKAPTGPLTIDPKSRDSRNLHAAGGVLINASPSEIKSNSFPSPDVGPDGALLPQTPMAEGSLIVGPGRQNSGKHDVEDKHKISQPVKTAVVKYLGQGKSDEKLTSFARSPTPKKNPTPFRKQATYSQDTSIERLHREATCDKLWRPSASSGTICSANLLN